MVTYQYAPVSDGGAERQAQRLAETLAARGRRVAVVTARWPGLPAHEVMNGVEVHRIFAIPRNHLLSATFLSSLAVFLATRGRDYDIWHVHQAYYNALIALELASVFKKATLVKVAASGKWGDFARLAGRRLGRRTIHRLREASAVIVLNDESVAEARYNGVPADRVRLIPNGIDSRAFAPPTQTERSRAREALGLSDDARVAVYSGRLVQEKGIHDALSAWPAVATGNPSARLVIAGGGDIADIRRRVAGMPTISVLGKVPDVRPVLRAADLLVLPSYSEGISNAVLEAMAMGIPVVGTNIPGIREPVVDGICGNLVAVGDTIALSAAITRLLKHDDIRLVYATACRARIREQYDLDVVADRYGDIYDVSARA